jgi:DNA-binding beta-propeller fold protein YncE
MKMTLRFCLGLLLVGAGLAAHTTPQANSQTNPQPTGLPGKPFYFKTTWMVGGQGDWDFIRLDPSYMQLLIAHGPEVQVVDLESGAVVGRIGELLNAADIALDDHGEFGYISDGRASRVLVYDRRTHHREAWLPTGPSPRTMVFEPSTRLLFVVCGPPVQEAAANDNASPQQIPRSTARVQPRQAAGTPTPEPGSFQLPKATAASPHGPEEPRKSVITVIDTARNAVLGSLLVHGRAGFIDSDGDGHVFVNIVNESSVIRLDAAGVQSFLEKKATAAAESVFPVLDWSGGAAGTRPPSEAYREFGLGNRCIQPQGLAVDGRDLRLFVACSDRKMAVVNADTGQVMTTVPTGSGTGVIAYDAPRELIFAANGDVGGSLTVIQRDVTDTYNVVQTLPTTNRARVLAVNPSTGDVYLASDAAQTGTPAPEGPNPRTARRPSTFHVLVIGH